VRTFLFCCCFVLLAGASGTPDAAGQDVAVLAPTGQWVTDRADMLSDTVERTLSRKLASYADTTSTQIIVVTLPTLDGVPASDYATALGRSWGVGQQGQDNGVVILASRDDRQVFIATGYGLEGAIPDIIAGRIVRNVIVPNFRQGRFYDGLSGAADALIVAARGEYEAEPDRRTGRRGLPIDPGLILLIIIIVVTSLSNRNGGGRGGGRRYGSRRRGLPPGIIWGGGWGSGGGGGGFGGGGGGFGGFGGGGGGFGGGGAGGSW
jgi:uncharacterized protein